MNVYTLKDIAEELGVTYEAVRQQTIRYSDELKGHITKQGKKQFIDEEGLDFLRTKRREYHVIVQEDRETVEALQEQIESLRASLIKAQNELLASKDKIISLQEEVRVGIESKLKNKLLLEDMSKKESELAEIRSERDAIKEERESLKAEKEQQREQIVSLQAESETLKAESTKKDEEIERLASERDAAMEESQSYHKSWFGFYRKG